MTIRRSVRPSLFWSLLLGGAVLGGGAQAQRLPPPHPVPHGIVRPAPLPRVPHVQALPGTGRPRLPTPPGGLPGGQGGTAGRSSRFPEPPGGLPGGQGGYAGGAAAPRVP